MKKVIKKSSLVIAILVSLVILVKIISSGVENQKRETKAESFESSVLADSSLEKSQEGETVEVAEVVDGDTIELKDGRFVRYIGIDTPEKEECFYEEAKEANEIVEGKKISIIKDVSHTDKYGRLLRYVHLKDIDINKYLVREGFARATNFPPDEKAKDEFRKAENEARENKKGMWADGACE